MRRNIQEEYIGYSFTDEVKQSIKMTLDFAKAVGEAQDDINTNLVVSGYNAAMCLSMVAMGAAENTREEMAQAILGVSGDDLAEEVAKLKELNNQILDANKESITLLTANAVWVDSALPLNDNFKTDLEENFDADISNEDFGNPATVDKINQWASDNTNELIDSIKEELSSDDVMVLASALYVKAPWTHEFDKDLTEDKLYVADDGIQYMTPTMKQEYEEGQAQYLDTDDYEAVSLTYGKEDYDEGKYPTMRLIMLRPKDENVSARDFLASQANGKLPLWSEPHAFASAEGTLEMPHIETKDKHDLRKPLENMGIGDAFDSAKANFKPMTANGAQLFVSDVTQDIVFKTNEEGSEAAAITQATMTLESVSLPPEQFDIKFDRSFVLAMQDMRTGAILFAGAINKPNNDMNSSLDNVPDEAAVTPQFTDADFA